jgi:hypothetical protein
VPLQHGLKETERHIERVQAPAAPVAQPTTGVSGGGGGGGGEDDDEDGDGWGGGSDLGDSDSDSNSKPDAAASNTAADATNGEGDAVVGSPVSWTWWVRLRLTLLAQLDRLDTLYAVHLGNFAPAAYASFRAAGIGEAAMALAGAGNPRAVEQLLKRHPRCGAPRLLDALDALPEMMPPSQYAGLLPWALPWCGEDAPAAARGGGCTS